MKVALILSLLLNCALCVFSAVVFDKSFFDSDKDDNKNDKDDDVFY